MRLGSLAPKWCTSVNGTPVALPFTAVLRPGPSVHDQVVFAATKASVTGQLRVPMPEPVLLRTSSRPPTSSARSRIPCKPKCPAGPGPDHLLVNALPIVAHAQPQLPRVETDLQRNLPRHSVAIGIAHSFVGDLIHLRADDLLQRPRCAVHDDVDRRSIRPVGGELITIVVSDRTRSSSSSNSRRPCTPRRPRGDSRQRCSRQCGPRRTLATP
jgi:hypothetical protein